MGKSSSKLSAESLERLRSGGSASGSGGDIRAQATTSVKIPATTTRHDTHHLSKSFSLDVQSSSSFPTIDAQFLDGLAKDKESFYKYLRDTFHKEVDGSDSMQTLFRGNCLASKVMSYCFRKYGSEYLKQLLRPHIAPLSEISYEIDSTRLVEENVDIDVNQKNLLRLTKQILDSILSSANEFPQQLNSMCDCLRTVICTKYPNSDTHQAIGTVIFLRFINPAIVSPFEAGIVDKQPPPKILRGLMLVSKILQNIANNVEFSKEEHMLPFNDFVRTQFEPVREWVRVISTVKTTGEQA